MAERIKRILRLYRLLMLQDVKAKLTYQADFAILIVASILTQTMGFIFIAVIYDRIPDINGWKFWHVVTIYAASYAAQGASSLLFDGCWTISELVNKGDMDRLLLRPIPPVLQVLGARVGLSGLGHLITGLVLLSLALPHLDAEWSIGKIVFAGVLFLSAVVIHASINLAACSVALWTHQPGNAFPFLVHSLGELTRFPIVIYPIFVQALITVFVPYAFVSVFPVAYLRDLGGWALLGLLSPLVAIYCAVLAGWVFRRGIAAYEKIGG